MVMAVQALWGLASGLLKHDRTIKKYVCLLHMLSYLHYVWTAQKPVLTYQKSERGQELIRKCSLLVKKYHPTWYLLNNGHLHTIFLSFYESHPRIEYERQTVGLSDGGIVTLDWTSPPGVPRSEINRPDVPTVVIFHGLTGGSGDNYVCIVVDKLIRQGWRVVVMNARGCAQTPVLTARLFCGAYTNDVREVVALLRRDHVQTSPLISVGFSLGSNIMVKYIGEEGDKCMLTAAVSVGNPYDFMCNSRNMNHSFVHHHVYNGALAENLKRLFFVRSNAHEHFLGHPEVDLDALRDTKRVSDFDEHLTRRAFGYKSVSDYYRDASSNQYLKHVKIPLLLLSAEDDPICIYTATPHDDVMANENLMLAMTSTGGHLGFFTGNSLLEIPDMWSANVVVQFCNAIDEIKPERKSVMRRLFPMAKDDTIGHVWPPSNSGPNNTKTTEADEEVDVEDPDEQVSVTRLATTVLGVVLVFHALKHRHLIHKKWWN
ncbi:Aste57867_24792 [Aphanomyces stellatus]|uniref:Aste57867_24792 protein n=1 Tax=Aphanomyces stellatus TaxID=120398 RepID=A0A485LVM6_9STRA|nr:hypothetical protein As57867_024714 [Aphanomyces stellatus]VFU01427.1 Aste57867_24792 [Aphanomyces stellatus]